MENIVIAGDFFPVPSNFAKFASGDIAYLLGEDLRRLFFNASYRICNLEGALTDHPGKCEKTGPVIFAPTSTIEAYKSLKINCCTLANNHITDAGGIGVKDTIHTLDEADIAHIGAGDSVDCIQHYLFFRVGAKRICLYNVCETMYNAPSKTNPGAFLYDEYFVCKELGELKNDCDFLIVIYHGGVEKYRYPSPQTRKRFHRMVDNGANMILSQHTHCVGSEEYYKGAYLLYGQGNFLFRSFNNEFTDTGLVIELQFDDKGFHVKKHLVRAQNDRVEYDVKQDFAAFDERSARIGDEAFLDSQFQDYCLNELPLYLRSYKGKYPFYKILGHFFPSLCKKYVMRSYERKQLLFTLHSLRSEQNREVVIEGITTYLSRFRKA